VTPGKPKRPGNDEPEPTLEDDLPSDGRDEKGEAMIRDLPDNVGTPQAPRSPGGRADDSKNRN
jgi:hypothetical protein